MAARKRPYLNQFTGDVLVLTKQAAKKLSEDWKPVQFIRNDKGEQVMRMQFNGATVDVSENEQKEVVPNGVGKSE